MFLKEIKLWDSGVGVSPKGFEVAKNDNRSLGEGDIIDCNWDQWMTLCEKDNHKGCWGVASYDDMCFKEDGILGSRNEERQVGSCTKEQEENASLGNGFYVMWKKK